MHFPFHIVTFIFTASFTVFSGIKGNELKWKWEVWEDIPSTSQLRVYIFNLTNPDEFEDGEKPVFKEMGPYVFQERREKVGIVHSEDGSSVTFQERKTYDFILSESVGSDNDLVTIINIPLLTFGKILSAVPYVGPNYFRSLIKRKEKLTRRNERIGDVFYYGFDAEPYVKILRDLSDKPIPEQFSGGRFGLFKGRNGSDDGSFQIGTGSDNRIPYGQILSWQNETKLKWWNGEGCNALNGTPFETFDPNSLSHAYLYKFDPDVCRSLKYTFHGKTKFQHITAWKYTLGKDLLEDPRIDSNNLCFCSKPGENREKCFKKGIIDLGPCRNGAPLVLSFPHFLHADESYRNAIGGMEHKKGHHHSGILIEPKTGTVLQETKRFQLNIHMEPLSSLTYLRKVPDLLLPVLWSERIYTVNEEAVLLLKEELKNHPYDEDDVDEKGSWNELDSPNSNLVGPSKAFGESGANQKSILGIATLISFALLLFATVSS